MVLQWWKCWLSQLRGGYMDERSANNSAQGPFTHRHWKSSKLWALKTHQDWWGAKLSNNPLLHFFIISVQRHFWLICGWGAMNWVKYLKSPGKLFCLQQLLHLEDPGFPLCLGSWHTWPWPGTPHLSSWLASGCKAGWPYGSASAQKYQDARLQLWGQTRTMCVAVLVYLVQRYVLDQSTDHSPGRRFPHIHLLHVQSVGVRMLLGFDYMSHAQIQTRHVHLGFILARGGLFLLCFISS